ncbi:hypothetical protein ACFVWG_20705 [Kribbella sp. NPDC058245]|uniref:hypothetical protein n=1 Tax=Kribbella sp. NPDC058245 TaxID=3346399 RepID=UPI0036E6D4E2
MSAHVAPLVPPGRGLDSTTKQSAATPGRTALPLPALAIRRTSTAVYGLSTIDNRGRLVDTKLMRALAWKPDLQAAITATRGVLIITPDVTASLRVTSQGQVRIPAPPRHLCALIPGDRVFLATDSDRTRVQVYSPAALDVLLANGATS